MALFCHSSLSVSHLRVSVPEEVEALWIRITPPRNPLDTASIIYCVVYHPLRTPTLQLLTNHIIHTGATLKVRFPVVKLVICGDFNRLDVSNIKHKLNLSQVVDFPTHNQQPLTLSSLTWPSSTRLHCSTHFTIMWPPAPTISVSKSAVTVIYRPMPDSAIREFGQWLVQHP